MSVNETVSTDRRKLLRSPARQIRIVQRVIEGTRGKLIERSEVLSRIYGIKIDVPAVAVFFTVVGLARYIWCRRNGVRKAPF